MCNWLTRTRCNCQLSRRQLKLTSIHTPMGSEKRHHSLKPYAFTCVSKDIRCAFTYMYLMNMPSTVRFRTFSSQRTSVTVSAEHVHLSSNFINNCCQKLYQLKTTTLFFIRRCYKLQAKVCARLLVNCLFKLAQEKSVVR